MQSLHAVQAMSAQLDRDGIVGIGRDDFTD